MNEYKSKVQKRPLILFSGGLDSTYAVLSQLAVSSVDLLIVKSNRLYDVQERAEEKARKAIIKKIKQETENGRLKHGIVNIHTVTMNFEHSTTPSYSDKFAQVRFWLLAALETIDPNIHSHLYIGYVSGDQITPHISGLKKVWKHLYSVSKLGKVKVSFPLLYMTKQDLIDRLQTSGNLEYLDMVWYCERPIEKPKQRTKPCGTCMSCKRMPAFKKEDVSKIIEVK